MISRHDLSDWIWFIIGLDKDLRIVNDDDAQYSSE